jgi:prolyl oligopeptidase
MQLFGRVLAGALIVASVAGASAPVTHLQYPVTKRVPVTTSYFQTTETDPYRWLENSSDPDVITWANQQTKLAFTYLSTAPNYAAIAARVAELSRTGTTRRSLVIRGSHFIYERQTPPEAQPEVVVRNGIDVTERVLFDPQQNLVGNVEPQVDEFVPSNDGSKVAVVTELPGSDDQTIHLVDTSTGKLLPESISHVGGGESPVAIAWDGDDKGFLHTQWPLASDGSYRTTGMLVYHHVLGSESYTDTYAFGRGLPENAQIHLASSIDGNVAEIGVAAGDGVPETIYLRRGDAPFVAVATPDAGIGSSQDPGGAFVGDAFYAIAHKRESRGEVVALLPGGFFATAKIAVPASYYVIKSVIPVAGGFITSDLDAGDGKARLFDRTGKQINSLPIPAFANITTLTGDPSGGPIVAGYETYTTRDEWLSYDPESNVMQESGIGDTGTGDFSNVVAERVFVPSQDGRAKIPLELVHEKDVKLDGTAPTMLNAYGAYGSITSPHFIGPGLAWLERGGVLAYAKVRGGGEYGESWHQAARLGTKTVSSDDLASCAMWLAKNGYADADHLGIMGGSAGGFLMGLALTRNPELYRAVLAQVGIYDLLRFELTPTGLYNTPEFGTVKDPDQFAWMYKESPYQNVHPGTPYPAVLMTTGANDARVDPYNSRKMVAELQADSSSANPILLIQQPAPEHAVDPSYEQRVENSTIVYTFFDSQLR